MLRFNNTEVEFTDLILDSVDVWNIKMKGKKVWVLQDLVGWNTEKWLLFIKSCFNFGLFCNQMVILRVFSCCHTGAPPLTRSCGTKPHKTFTFPAFTFATWFLFCFHDNRSCWDELG